MEKNLVGYRFSPTEEEVINYYLLNMILGNQWLVNEAMNVINICAYDPEFLPSLSKLDSKDLVWYFFTPREYTASKKGTKRTTPSGYWKATGVDRTIKDKRGNGVEIGIKKTLVYHQGKSSNGVWTPWVMHEYHITSLPPTQSNYVICKVMYKGEDGDSLYGNNSNELNHSTMVSDLEITTAPEAVQPREDDFYMSMEDLPNPVNEQDDPSLFNPDMFFDDNYCPYQQPETPWDEDYINNLLNFNGGNFDDVLGDTNITMQEHRNDHKPKKALTGIIVDCSSDSDSADAESISATSYQETSSPESFHSLSAQFHTEIPSLRKDSLTDIQPHAETSINRKIRKSQRTIPSKLEVKAVDASMSKKKSSSSASMVKKEKKVWFITKEVNRKSPPYIHLMNMIIGFILLVAVIGNIISVSLSVKT